MENGASFAQVANNLVGGEKPNISCLVTDFGSVNATLAQPTNMKNLQSALDLNHFFFDAVWVAVQPGTQNLDWFRVQLLPPQQPPGAAYNPRRKPPDIFPGNACTNRFGHGVGRVVQIGRFYLAPGSQLHLGV